MSHFTHAYFPKERFDRVELKGPRVYAQHGNVFVALLGGSPLSYRSGSTEDLIQEGRDTIWVCEISTAGADGDFDSFVRRVEGNPVSYRDGVLAYQTGARHLELGYGREFRVNGIVQDSAYPRHASPYARTARKARTMAIELGGQRLLLDFENRIRREEQGPDSHGRPAATPLSLRERALLARSSLDAVGPAGMCERLD